MPKVITTGKTIEEAIEKALIELGGIDRELVSVEVLEKPKAGFLGIGGTEAKISAKRYDEPDEPEVAPAPAPAPTAAKKPAEAKKPAQAKKEDEPKRAGGREIVPNKCTEFSDVVGFLEELLVKMGASASVSVRKKDDENLVIDMEGANMGMLIGRRGETLDALQHIANLVANKCENKKMRIMLDTEGYRAKREETLERLAQKMAAQAVKYRKSKTLEPMNAYERHVIHAALQDTENVSTRSIGIEPNRRVVIAYSGPGAHPHYNNNNSRRA